MFSQNIIRAQSAEYHWGTWMYEEFIHANLSKKSLRFFAPEDLLLCSRNPDTCPYPETDESSINIIKLSLSSTLILFSRLYIFLSIRIFILYFPARFVYASIVLYIINARTYVIFCNVQFPIRCLPGGPPRNCNSDIRAQVNTILSPFIVLKEAEKYCETLPNLNTPKTTGVIKYNNFVVKKRQLLQIYRISSVDIPRG